MRILNFKATSPARKLAYITANFLVLTMIVALAGCQTVRMDPDRGKEPIETKNIVPVPSSRAQQGAGAVLMVVEFHGLDLGAEDAICRWRMVNTENGKNFFVNMKADQTNVFAQLDPGTYKTNRLGCGVSRVWDIEDAFKEGFRVEPGLVSYVGKVIFEFQKGELQLVRKTSRRESAEAFGPAMDSTAAAGLPAISGFTGKPLDRQMVDIADTKDGFDVVAKGVDNPQKTLQPLLSHLSTCAKEETSADPIRFGRLDYTAVYKEGRFSEMKDRQEKNAFSDRLRSCVERGIMAFHPTRKNDIEVRVRY
jgi:hypothetical protein